MLRITRQNGMKITYDMKSLYDTKQAQMNADYRLWLTGFSRTGQTLTGVNPILDLRLHRRAYVWYQSGLTPYMAVKTWQGE